ncbi:hypothetical protein [Flexivirga meconopsidis]|uniref:hypothetical protein n=1 Tax=Flexivirga meconopsidis TaxID=2977121 RepID=UPI00223E9940|nr:hypothetical protein [Flexivirga meconopsidis]
MTTYATVITTPRTRRTRSVFGSLRGSAGCPEIGSAALVERTASGAMRVAERTLELSLRPPREDSLLPSLISAVGARMASLFGRATKSVVGTPIPARGVLDPEHPVDTVDCTDTIDTFAGLVSHGGVAIVAETCERDTSLLDLFVTGFGGMIARRPSAQVAAELRLPPAPHGQPVIDHPTRAGIGSARGQRGGPPLPLP